MICIAVYWVSPPGDGYTCGETNDSVWRDRVIEKSSKRQARQNLGFWRSIINSEPKGEADGCKAGRSVPDLTLRTPIACL